MSPCFKQLPQHHGQCVEVIDRRRNKRPHTTVWVVQQTLPFLEDAPDQAFGLQMMGPREASQHLQPHASLQKELAEPAEFRVQMILLSFHQSQNSEVSMGVTALFPLHIVGYAKPSQCSRPDSKLHRPRMECRHCPVVTPLILNGALVSTCHEQ
jgi:hypothetical protein